MRLFTTIFLVIIIFLGVTFACLNAEPVSINYYVGKQLMPLSLLLVLTLIIGMFIGFLMGVILFVKSKRENRRLNHRIRLAEKEIANLRTIPLKNDR